MSELDKLSKDLREANNKLKQVRIKLVELGREEHDLELFIMDLETTIMTLKE
jgi:hypothetical protein